MTGQTRGVGMGELRRDRWTVSLIRTSPAIWIGGSLAPGASRSEMPYDSSMDGTAMPAMRAVARSGIAGPRDQLSDLEARTRAAPPRTDPLITADQPGANRHNSPTFLPRRCVSLADR
jgi:hypothetical protein